MKFWKKIASLWSKNPRRPGEDILSGDFAAFESWITSTIDGPFLWRIRPRDDRDNRIAVIDSILNDIQRNHGQFPTRNTFIERAAVP